MEITKGDHNSLRIHLDNSLPVESALGIFITALGCDDYARSSHDGKTLVMILSKRQENNGQITHNALYQVTCKNHRYDNPDELVGTSGEYILTPQYLSGVISDEKIDEIRDALEGI